MMVEYMATMAIGTAAMICYLVGAVLILALIVSCFKK